MTRPRTWTDDQLRQAAATSRTLREIVAKLGLRPTGGAHRDITRAAARLGVALPAAQGRPRTWTDDDLRRAVTECTSLREVSVHLGLVPNGRSNRTLHTHAARLGLVLPVDRAGEVRRLRAENQRLRSALEEVEGR